MFSTLVLMEVRERDMKKEKNSPRNWGITVSIKEDGFEDDYCRVSKPDKDNTYGLEPDLALLSNYLNQTFPWCICEWSIQS